MFSASLETLSDDDLHLAARRLTALSNVALADLLAYLGEVEARGIHRERACASLYTYCVYELRMSEDSAFRRAKAARLLHQHPDLRNVLARGEIHLTGLLMIAPYLGGERRAEVLERARFRSKREIARLIAELDPKPGVIPSIVPVAVAQDCRPAAEVFAAFAGPVRNLPAGDRPGDWIELEHDATSDVGSAPERGPRDLDEAERALASARQWHDDAHTERPLRYKVQFTASQEYVNLLEEAFDLLGLGRAAGLPEVQLRALRELVERLRKQKRGAPMHVAGTAPARVSETSANAAQRRDTEGTPPAAPTRTTETSAAPARVSHGSRPGRGRYVPVAVRRAVWARDASRCAYVDAHGHRCSEKCGLEVHHRHAHALGGAATVENLELRCRAHNVLAAEQDFGREHMEYATSRREFEPGRQAITPMLDCEGGAARATREESHGVYYCR